ncbi:MAG: response regulator [Waterburya sp.]
MIRILLVDDQNLVQQGIKSLLARDPDLEIVGTLQDGRSAVSKVAELSPDIVLLDIEMPGMDGITATKYITRLAPQTKVIILSSHEDKKYLTQALMAGARAYLLKDSLVKDLKRSIIAVNNGYSQMESRLLAKIFHPSNLKSNSRQKTDYQDQQLKRSPNSTVKKTTQAKVVQQAPPSRKQSVMLAKLVAEDSTSDTATLNQSPSNDHNADSKSVDGAFTQLSGASNYARQASKPPNSFEVQPVDLKPISTAPKVNLPHSELENFDTAPMESGRELVEVTDITTNQALTVTAVQPLESKLPITKQFLRVPFKNIKHKYSQLIAQYQAMLAQVLTSQSLKHQPLINRYQSQMAQYKYQLSPLLKKWQKKGWLTNAGLALLGLVTVIIISLIFS